MRKHIKHYSATLFLETGKWDIRSWDCEDNIEDHTDCVINPYEEDRTKPYAVFDTGEPALCIYAEHHESEEQARQLVLDEVERYYNIFRKFCEVKPL
jgi:hypothetical protein